MISNAIRYLLILAVTIHIAAEAAHAEKPVKPGDPGVVEVRLTGLIAARIGKIYGTVEVVETTEQVVDGKRTIRIVQRSKILDIPQSRPFMAARGGYAPDTSKGDKKAELFSNNSGKRTGHVVHKVSFKTKLGTPLKIRADLKEIGEDGEVSLIPLDKKKLIVPAGHITKDSRTRGEHDFWDERYTRAVYFKYDKSKKQTAYLGFDVYVQNDFRERTKKANRR